MRKKLWVLRVFCAVSYENRDAEHLDFILVLYTIKLIIADFNEKNWKLNKKVFSHKCNYQDQILL